MIVVFVVLMKVFVVLISCGCGFIYFTIAIWQAMKVFVVLISCGCGFIYFTIASPVHPHCHLTKNYLTKIYYSLSRLLRVSLTFPISSEVGYKHLSRLLRVCIWQKIIWQKIIIPLVDIKRPSVQTFVSLSTPYLPLSSFVVQYIYLLVPLSSFLNNLTFPLVSHFPLNFRHFLTWN